MRMRYCAYPGGCSALVPNGRCQQHRITERHRPNVDVRRWYRTPRWESMREKKKDEAPFCVECQKEGRLQVWTELDHIVPHRGDLVLFWDESNLQGLCASHHSEKTGKGL